LGYNLEIDWENEASKPLKKWGEKVIQKLVNQWKLPTTNKKFWKEKIEGNKRKDKSVKIKLKKMGWDYLAMRD
jgi:G:T-mismatch repair DNA endonuclease (very short patch repair protein)